MNTLSLAPPLQIREWLNAPADFGLSTLRGRVVVIEAFQMLCPGCVSHGLPQAQRIIESFELKDVAVIGLHTVFEHHAAQGARVALEAFANEYRLSFPIGIDTHDAHGVPQTMSLYRMQGTPTLILIDRQGRLRLQHFGCLDDMRVGATIMSLVVEAPTILETAREQHAVNLRRADSCSSERCPI